MHNFTDKIFERLDIQQLRSFLLECVDNFAIDSRTYSQRLKEDSNAIYKRLENLCPDESKLDEVIAELSQALVSYENVYTEIGIKIGAKLIHQLLL